jgi:hypothetical protein
MRLSVTSTTKGNFFVSGVAISARHIGMFGQVFLQKAGNIPMTTSTDG